MGNISILTVGDSSCDSILEVDEQDAGLICNLKTQKCEITFNYGEKIPVSKIHRGFGGSALNCALGFAKIGLDAKIATIVGNDEQGKNIISFLHQNKIGLKNSAVQGYSNQATIISFKSERTIFSYHAPREYSQLKLNRADWVYFSSAGKGSENLINFILDFEKSGSKIAFNPGAWQLKNFDLFSPLLKVCDVLILNRQEADLIIGLEGNIKKQLKQMLALGPSISVITDARNGAYFATGENALHLNATSGKSVDATGAGDGFSSAFVGALALGKSLEESAKWGMVNSGSVVEFFGANQGLLSKDQITQKLESIKSFKITLL